MIRIGFYCAAAGNFGVTFGMLSVAPVEALQGLENRIKFFGLAGQVLSRVCD